MIRTLKIRLTLVVLALLLLASAGLVAVINYRNLQSVENQAYGVLEMLAENGGQRPQMLPMPSAASGEQPPEKPEGEDIAPPQQSDDAARRGGEFKQFGRRDRTNSVQNAVSLINFYTIQLDSQGAVVSWGSDRQDLYSDGDIRDIAEEIMARSQDKGRVDTQFYCRTENAEGTQLIVVDARLEMQNARQVLRTTALVALGEDLLLSVGAILLIRRAVRPVDEAMEKQKQFVWDASHELKTPLAVISANAEALAADPEDRKPLAYIQSEVKRSDQLIQSLLTLARMEKNTGEVPKKKFDLGRALEEVALPFESAVFEAGKRMDLRIPEKVYYTGNEDMLKQLMVILLSNAEKYSDDGGKITVMLDSRGEKRIITVHNTGPAIPKSAQAKIFDRFYRVDSSHNREIEGNGLGLAIARNIVDIHKGKIAVFSEEGKGTAFTVTL